MILEKEAEVDWSNSDDIVYVSTSSGSYGGCNDDTLLHCNALTDYSVSDMKGLRVLPVENSKLQFGTKCVARSAPYQVIIII